MNSSLLDGKLPVEPSLVMAAALEEYHRRTNGSLNVVDANNTFTFLLEMMSRMTSEQSTIINKEFDRLYPKRAHTFSDLYCHMSDYDYLGFYSSPASTKLRIYLPLNYLLREAELVPPPSGNMDEAVWRRVVIPKESTFVYGDLTFGLFYDIHIDINNSTGHIICSWNVEEPNTLLTLTQGTITTEKLSHGGVQVISFVFDVYQFNQTNYKEPVTRTSGFIKTYEYSDRFYAAKVFYEDNSGRWREMKQTLSARVYDVSSPTAQIVVNPNVKRVKIMIPQLYFTNLIISSNIRVEIYTTKGAMNHHLGDIETAQIDISIPMENPYSKLFGRLPFADIMFASVSITGGSNGYGFDELKRRVVDDSFHAGVPITLKELNNYFIDKGFTPVRYQDGITNRVYQCYRLLLDTLHAPIGAGGLQVILPPMSEADDQYIVDNGDSSFTLLPSLIYSMDELTGLAVYNSSLRTIDTIVGGLSGSAKAKVFNDKQYLFSPFHTRIHVADRYPVAYSYYLLSPRILEILFVQENRTITERVSTKFIAVNSSCRGVDSGILFSPEDPTYNGYYTFTANIDAFVNETYTDLHLLIVMPTSTGAIVGKIVTIETLDTDNIVLEFTLGTKYVLIGNDSIELHGMSALGMDSWNYHPLVSEMQLYFFGVYNNNGSGGGIVPMDGIPIEISRLYDYLRGSDTHGHFLDQQSIKIHFGERIDEIHNGVTVDLTRSEYAVHTMPAYAQYPHPIFQSEDDGAVNWTDTEIEDWTFVAGIPSYDLVVNGDTAVAVSDGDSNVNDIATGMAVENIGGIGSLITVTNVSVVDNVATLTLSADTGLTNEEIVAIIGSPETGLIAMTEIYREGDWIIAKDDARDSLVDIIDTGTSFEVVLTYEPNAFEILVFKSLFVFNPVTNTYTNDPNVRKVGLVSSVFEPGTYISSISVVGDVWTLHLSTDIPESDDVNIPISFGIPELVSGIGNIDRTSQLTPRSLIYRVQMCVLDAKFLVSKELRHVNFLRGTADQIASYCDAVSAISPNLLEVTDLRFIPFRTIGMTPISIGDGFTRNVSVSFEISLKLYIPSHVGLSEDEKLQIRETIIDIIDEKSVANHFSSVDIVSTIQERLSDKISHVDILGFANIDSVDTPQTLVSQENTVVFALKHKLYSDPNGNIRVDRGLTLTYVSI